MRVGVASRAGHRLRNTRRNDDRNAARGPKAATRRQKAGRSSAAVSHSIQKQHKKGDISSSASRAHCGGARRERGAKAASCNVASNNRGPNSNVEICRGVDGARATDAGYCKQQQVRIRRMKKGWTLWKYVKRNNFKAENDAARGTASRYGEGFKLLKLALYAMRDQAGCTCQEIASFTSRYFGKEDTPMLRHTIHKQLRDYVERGRVKQLKRGLYCLPKFELTHHHSFLRRRPWNPPSFPKRNASVFGISSSSTIPSFANPCISYLSSSSQRRSSSSLYSSRGRRPIFSVAPQLPCPTGSGYLTLSKARSRAQRSALYARGGPMVYARHSEHVHTPAKISRLISLYGPKLFSSCSAASSSPGTPASKCSRISSGKGALKCDASAASPFPAKTPKIEGRSSPNVANETTKKIGGKAEKNGKSIFSNDGDRQSEGLVTPLLSSKANSNRRTGRRKKRRRGRREAPQKASVDAVAVHECLAVPVVRRTEQKSEIKKESKTPLAKLIDKRRDRGSRRRNATTALRNGREVNCGKHKDRSKSEHLGADVLHGICCKGEKEGACDLSPSVSSTTCTTSSRRISPVHFRMFEAVNGINGGGDCECVTTTSSSPVSPSSASDVSLWRLGQQQRDKKACNGESSARPKNNRSVGRGRKRANGCEPGWDASRGHMPLKIMRSCRDGSTCNIAKMPMHMTQKGVTAKQRKLPRSCAGGGRGRPPVRGERL